MQPMRPLREGWQGWTRTLGAGSGCPACFQAKLLVTNPYSILKNHSALLGSAALGVLVWRVASHPLVSTHLRSLPSGPATVQPQSEDTPLLTRTAPAGSEADEETAEIHVPPPLGEIMRRDPRGSSEEERLALWTFLETAQEADRARNSAWILGVDQTLAWLRGATQGGPEIETGLIRLIGNEQLSMQLRELALSHLGIWSEEHPVSGTVLETLKRIAQTRPFSRLSGLALTALTKGQFAGQESGWIASIAIQILSETSAAPARITALQLIAQVPHSHTAQAKALAQRLLAGPSTTAERIGALQLLGQIGDQKTLAWLLQSPEESDPLAADTRKSAVENLRLNRSPGPGSLGARSQP